MGTVYRATESRTGMAVAVKHASDDGGLTAERLRTEIRITGALDHPNVVRFLGHEWAGGDVWICLELVVGGSMDGVLQAHGRLSGSVLQSATQDLISGVEYLHGLACPVLHRDLKAANLLVRSDGRVAIADFGCSTTLEEEQVRTRAELVGSVPWMAPEVIMKTTYGLATDVWSMGCTVLEMATAERPWGNLSFDNMFVAMRTIGMTQAVPAIADDVPTLCADLIARCTRRRASERPSAAELLRHDFLA